MLLEWMVGTWLFFGFLAVLFFLEVLAVEFEKYGWATSILIISLLLLQFLFGVPIIGFVATNPMLVIPIFVGYFLVGGLYSALWKWKIYVKEELDNVVEKWHNYSGTVTPRGTLEEALEKHAKSYLMPDKNYDRIITWIIFWPFSIIIAVFRDPLKWIVERVFDLMKKLYEYVVLSTVRAILQKNKEVAMKPYVEVLDSGLSTKKDV